MATLPDTTLQGLETRRQDIAGAWWRRAFMDALTLVLVAGLAGWLGVRVATASASDSGWSLDVRYAATARAGLDVPLEMPVRHEGGFGGKTVTLAFTSDSFDIFETQGFHPSPSDETRDGKTLYLTFNAPPSGDTFVAAYDAYIQPASQVGRTATIGVIDQGDEVAVVHVHTRLLP